MSNNTIHPIPGNDAATAVTPESANPLPPTGLSFSSPAEAGVERPFDPTEENDMEDWTLQRDALKMEGDNAYRNQHYSTALHYYTMALSLDPKNGALLSNRSATHLKLNYKSKALQDAISCVETQTMGNKGLSRYAAALQSLHRYDEALQQWRQILKIEPNHSAAILGQEICQQQFELRKKEEENKEQSKLIETNHESEMDKEEETTDDLDDFFNEVEEVTASVQMEKKIHADNDGSTNETATQAILNHKVELGTVQEQVERLVLRPNYTWYNLNPFYVLDIPYTSSKVEISRRYKALSLLLHPDRYSTSTDDNASNPTTTNDITKDQVQLAYDQVLNAKAILYDDDKLKHMRDLNEQGMKQGLADYQKLQSQKANVNSTNQPSGSLMSLDECQRRATYRLFATIEYTREQVLEREKSFYRTEQENSDRMASNERNIRQHDQLWQQSDRVHTRIDDWRSFQSQKKFKKA